MFAMCQPEVPLHHLFHEAKGNTQRDVACPSGRDCQPDNNLNFVGEEAYDSNDNWSQVALGELEQLGGNVPKISSDQILLTQQEKAKSRSRKASQGPSLDGMSFGSDKEEDIRRPPEGAEMNGLEQEKNTSEERIKESGKLASSPLEDNGYASSSLSIDSPDSGGATAWEMPVVASEDWRGQSPDAELEHSSPSSETLFPALAEAFRNLQDRKKFKEQEKEKHHVHLVMYRRLALLRWIRGLQQKVVDQQNRLQESFDTILDNRKELIRCVQQGMVHTKNPAQAEL